MPDRICDVCGQAIKFGHSWTSYDTEDGIAYSHLYCPEYD